jgi:hypothetical protein
MLVLPVIGLSVMLQDRTLGHKHTRMLKRLAAGGQLHLRMAALANLLWLFELPMWETPLEVAWKGHLHAHNSSSKEGSLIILCSQFKML